jgi:hypothetical protein
MIQTLLQILFVIGSIQNEMFHSNHNNTVGNCAMEISLVVHEMHWDLLANFP